MSNDDWSPRSPVRPASLVLLREADVCSILHDRLTGCREFGRMRGVRTRFPPCWVASVFRSAIHILYILQILGNGVDLPIFSVNGAAWATQLSPI